MNAWYDIVGLDNRSAESVEGISDSVDRIKDFISTENANGIPCSRITLAGFSQVIYIKIHTVYIYCMYIHFAIILLLYHRGVPCPYIPVCSYPLNKS